MGRGDAGGAAAESALRPTRARRPTVLVVDDDRDYAALLLDALRRRVPEVELEHAACVGEASARVDGTRVDALLLDVTLPDGEGLSVVRRLRAEGREIPFLVLSADGSAAAAVRALHAGAVDYLVKGATAFDRAAGLLTTLVARRAAEDGDIGAGLVGESPAIERLRAEIRRCARSGACVRIEGETGVGKELVARSIHQASPRRGPFVAINCGALPESLAEAELFGHVRGAYTGAAGDRGGLVEHAAGGTLLLDEIEDLPLSIQGKLLRLIQEAEYRPVGTSRTRRADVRILAASNRSLERMVEEGSFRRDLFYRLDVLRVRVPPLRERLSDLPALVGARLDEAEVFSERSRARPLPEELQGMAAYPWPGNVRELENFVERARVVASQAGWRAGWASALAQLPDARPSEPAGSSVVPESEPRLEEDGERRALERVLARHRWRREVVARELGISRVTLWRRMRRLGLLDEA